MNFTNEKKNNVPPVCYQVVVDLGEETKTILETTILNVAKDIIKNIKNDKISADDFEAMYDVALDDIKGISLQMTMLTKAEYIQTVSYGELSEVWVELFSADVEQ